ncbi:hypothetical protein Droror1_Dr00023322 [Drosera rotundifolia]
MSFQLRCQYLLLIMQKWLARAETEFGICDVGVKEFRKSLSQSGQDDGCGGRDKTRDDPSSKKVLSDHPGKCPGIDLNE